VKCKHPEKEVSYWWATENGNSINFQAGAGKVHQRFVCLQCGKNIRKPIKEKK